MTDPVQSSEADTNAATPDNAAEVPIALAQSKRGWRCCWGGFQCFASRKREKYRRPATQLVNGSATSLQNGVENGTLALDTLNQAAALSPLLHAPPSSPASIPYSDNSSSVQSPAALLTLFPLKSGNECTPSGWQFDSAPTNLASGSFPLETVLVTPPLISTLTTAPTTPLSTAPFTPPPELAHLTTPPSPEISFAELLASSLSIKCSLSEHASEQYTASLRFFPPPDLELAYQLHPGSPIGQLVSPRSGASSSGISSPLPERVPFLENGATSAASVSSISMLKNASFFGFGHVTSSSLCYANGVEVLEDKHHMQKDQHVQTEGAFLGNTGGADKRPRQDEYSCSLLKDTKVEESSLALVSAIQTTEAGGADSTLKCDNNCSRSSQNLPLDTVFEQPRPAIEVIMSRFGQQSKNNGNLNTQSNETAQVDGRMLHWNTCQLKKDNRLNSSPSAGSSSFEQLPNRVCGNMGYCGTLDGGTGCCSSCGELTSKCWALSEALKQTKEKLICIERRESLIDDRERKYKQLMQWMQLGVKSQQESIFRLSDELSWQEEAFLDLQAQHLAQLGIELPDVGSNLPTAENSSTS